MNVREVLSTRLAATLGGVMFGWLVVITAVWLGQGQLPTLDMLSHGDGGHYLKIATTGYEFFPCADGALPDTWCGNTAWQPLYPALIWVVSLVGIDPRMSALIVTALAGAYFTWMMLRDSQRSGASAWRFALLIAVAPGMVWMHAAFPITLMLVWSALAFRAAFQGQAWQAALWSALAILTHSSGFFISLSVGIVLLLSTVQWVRSFAAFIGIVFGAVLVWLAGLQLVVGSWQAWWLVQAKYYSDAGGVIGRLKALITHLYSPLSPQSNPGQFWSGLQSWVVVFLSAAALIAIWRASLPGKQKFAQVSQVAILGLIPFVVGGALSISRNQAQTTLFFTRLRLAAVVEWLLVAALTIIGAMICQLFLAGWID